MSNFQFLPSDFKVSDWESLEPFFLQLNDMPLSTEDDLNRFILSRTELEEAIDEDQAWRYIRINVDTQNEEYSKAFEYFIDEIDSKVESWTNKLDRKLAESSAMRIYESIHPIPARSLKNSIELFREESLPIMAELQKEEQEYGAIISEISLDINGKNYTLSQAAELLQEKDRDLREQVYRKISEKRVEKSETFNELLSSMLRKRYKIAINAGFKNYRDYQHKNLDRFDYTVDDISNFHRAIALEVAPLVDDILAERKRRLGIERLMPWDLQVDVDGKEPIRPFSDTKILVDKAVECFCRVDKSFGDIFRQLSNDNLLDLDSRFGKAPGGFNYPLQKSNRSFIFMNATGSMNDFEVLMHEGGHAFHANHCSHWSLADYKDVPAEVAELASMSMELISSEHWDTVINGSDLKRAKRNLLEGAILVLPWIAAVDKFQHWLYTHPEHTHHERDIAWTNIYREFSSSEICWEGVEEAFVFTWQRQLHIFEMPFYYIEYGFAQLGAIAIWKNYCENPEGTLGKYISMLKLGYSKPLPELYKEAGIEFAYNSVYVAELMSFVKKELEKLY